MEERNSDMVSEIQRERVLSEVVSVVFCDFDDFIPNTIEPKFVDESVIQGHRWLGHLGDSERRVETYN